MSRWHINFKNVKNFKKAELANEFIQEIHVLKNDNVRINKVVMELVKEKNQKFSKLF